MNIDAESLAKIATAFAGLGVGIATAKPFVLKIFERWLAAQDKRDEAIAARDRAYDRTAAAQERMVGVLEKLDERQDRIDARLDRIEGHLGIVPKSVPPPSASVSPRADITGEHAAVKG